MTTDAILMTSQFEPLPASMVWISSAMLGTATFLLCRLPLHWLSKRPSRNDQYGWDVDDYRRITLRKESAFFKRCEPWVVGLANGLRMYTPWLMDESSLPFSSKGMRRLATVLFLSPTKLARALASGVARGAWTIEEYQAAAWLAAISIGLVVAILFDTRILSLGFITIVLVVAFAVYRLQMMSLLKRATRRRSMIRKLLPHSLDTLAMTLSAGGTFAEAIEDLARDFPDHPLAQEFTRLLGDIHRGRTMYDSLVAMAARIDIVEFDDVLRTMTIAHEHGAPAANFFRTGASQMRTKQLRQMEVAIGKAEAQMPLPTMVIVVACMIIAVAPFAVMSLNSGFIEQFR
jgi:tight adherence protein C